MMVASRRNISRLRRMVAGACKVTAETCVNWLRDRNCCSVERNDGRRLRRVKLGGVSVEHFSQLGMLEQREAQSILETCRKSEG